MILGRIVDSRRITVALLRHNVKHQRSVELFHVLKHRNQHFEVMSVNRTVVVHPEFFKQRGVRSNHALAVLFGPFGQIEKFRKRTHNRFTDVSRLSVELSAHQLCKVIL